MPIDYGVTARLAYLQWLDSEETAEQEWIRVLRDYHAGNHPVYLTDRQKEFIGLEPRHSDHLFAHNLCSLIVATVAERMSVTGFTAGSVEDADAAPSPLALAASEWWEANRMDARQDDLYEMVLRDASAYLIVSWDADAGQPQWAMNQAYDGTQGVMVHTDPETDEVVFASKRWQMDWRTGGDNAGKTRLTLYFPDRVERYIQRDPKDRPDNDVDSEIMRLNWRTWRDAPGDPWPIWWTDDGTPIGDPLGMPVVAFDNPGGSEIDDVVSLQDLLNKSDLDLAAAADHSGFRITWASTGTMNINATGKQNDIRLAPGKMLELPEGSQLGSLEPADLSRMIATCHYWIESIAGQSRTPHYVLIPPGAEQPSGEALREQEIGLKSKCERKQRVWGNAWKTCCT